MSQKSQIKCNSSIPKEFIIKVTNLVLHFKAISKYVVKQTGQFSLNQDLSAEPLVVRPGYNFTTSCIKKDKTCTFYFRKLDSRLTISAAILYLVTTRSSAMVGISSFVSAMAIRF